MEAGVNKKRRRIKQAVISCACISVLPLYQCQDCEKSTPALLVFELALVSVETL